VEIVLGTPYVANGVWSDTLTMNLGFIAPSNGPANFSGEWTIFPVNVVSSLVIKTNGTPLNVTHGSVNIINIAPPTDTLSSPVSIVIASGLAPNS